MAAQALRIHVATDKRTTMADPSDFTSFADYLGLNDEAGRAMLERTKASHSGDEQNIQNLAQTRLANDRAGYGRNTGDTRAIQGATASYGDFLKGMADPQARQALMEKVYGKGAVSGMDSLLGGAGDQNKAAQSRLSGLTEQSDQMGKLGERAIGENVSSRQNAQDWEAKQLAATKGVKTRQDQIDAINLKAKQDFNRNQFGEWMAAGRGWESDINARGGLKDIGNVHFEGQHYTPGAKNPLGPVGSAFGATGTMEEGAQKAWQDSKMRESYKNWQREQDQKRGVTGQDYDTGW